MRQNLLALSGLACLIASVCCTPTSMAQGAPTVKLRDLSKGIIERPLEKTLAPGGVLPPLSQYGPLPATPQFVNPKVAPGKINWQTDFETACESAKTSGKPVLLFQMMGKLDDGFC
jgi:hypothetical protein